MTKPEPASADVREREARDARFFAWDVPGDANIVALVHESAEAERSATVVDAIATSVARRREHTLLLSARPGPTPLDELLGGADSEGLPAALGGRARLTDVAVQRGDRPFVYLPAGRDPEAIEELLGDDVLASFVARVRERGGTLFLVVSEDTKLSPEISELVDGYVSLGDATLPEGTEGLAAFGRVTFDESESGVELVADGPDDAVEASDADEATEEPAEAEVVAAPTAAEVAAEAEPEAAEAGAAPEASEEAPEPEAPEEIEASAPEEASDDAAESESDEAEDREAASDASPVVGTWSRHRVSSGFPMGPVVGGFAVVAVLVGGWWWFAGRVGDGAASTPEPATVARAEADAPATQPPPTEVPAAMDGAGAAQAFETAPEAAFSVLIASFADKPDADDRVARLNANAAGLFFSAPTPVRGVIYHRVFAGALEGEAQAQVLMDRLVESGDKDEASAWHMRPVRLAYDLGVYSSLDEADARIADLASRGVPSYSLSAGAGSDMVFRVYGGAYENERAALPMAEMLDDAGEAATLIARHGAVQNP